MVSSKEEEKEKEKPNETMKTHEVIKPRPLTLSTHSPWLNGKHNFVTQPVLDSDKDGNPRDPVEIVTARVPNQIADSASASQPSRDNVPILCEMWSDSLWNLGELVDNEKIGSCSSLQEYNYMEFSNVDDSFWDSNHGDFYSLCDL